MQHLLRNKITFIFLLVSALPFSGNAQRLELNQLDHDDERFHFGINLGVNRSHYNIEHSKRFLAFDSINVIESINSTGINLAGLVNVRISNHFDLRTYPIDLIFTEKAFQYTLKTPDKIRGEDTISIKKVQGITLAFPLQVKFTSDRIANLKVFMMLGGRIDYDLAANASKKTTDDIITLQKVDYGIEAGLGFHIYFPVFVLTPEIKLSHGLRNVLTKNDALKYSNTIDKITSRSLTFSLTVE